MTTTERAQYCNTCGDLIVVHELAETCAYCSSDDVELLPRDHCMLCGTLTSELVCAACDRGSEPSYTKTGDDDDD